MALDKIVNVGKYEAIRFIQDEETAKDYLDACINETARHSGCAIKEATAIERANILEFTRTVIKRLNDYLVIYLRKISK